MQYFWEIPGWELEDRHLKKVHSMPFQRKIPFLPKENGLYIVRGPRQIGKSSWLKAVLSHYVKKQESCFYLSCENISDHKELAEILSSVRDRKIVLLDEISFVKDWSRAVKHEVDSGHTHILMLTGSHSHDLKKGADLMPGRFDGGGEFELMPMLFEEFLEARKQANWKTQDRLEALTLYFKVGGFPAAVAEGGERGLKPTKSMATYYKWLQGDIIKLGKQQSYLDEILLQLALCASTPISFQTLAKKTSIGSHNTVLEYISVLESCFALRQLPAIDIDTSSFRFKKERKFYFTDPLIFWLAFALLGKKNHENIEEKIAEQVAHEYLARNHKRFGYFSNKNGLRALSQSFSDLVDFQCRAAYGLVS